MTKIREQIQIVIEARQNAAYSRVLHNDAMKKWQEDHKYLTDSIVNTSEILTQAEATLRAMTLAAFCETGNKNPAPGLAIRILTKLDYDQAKAFDWAQDHHMALKLDVSTFEKIAKASPLDFVTSREETQAIIATNLEKEYPPMKEDKHD